MIIIDRFEGDFAVCEINGKIKSINKKLLPENAKEGDCLKKRKGKYEIDTDATSLRRQEIIDLQNSLWE